MLQNEIHRWTFSDHKINLSMGNHRLVKNYFKMKTGHCFHRWRRSIKKLWNGPIGYNFSENKLFVEIPWSAVEISIWRRLKLNVFHDALFLQEATHSSKHYFFQNWRNFDNFQCIDTTISIHCNLFQSTSTHVQTANGKRLLNFKTAVWRLR